MRDKRHSASVLLAALFICWTVCSLRAQETLDALFSVPNVAVTTNAPPEAVGPSGSVLQFVDGSLLHGQLEGMDREKGLAWSDPEAQSPIHFQPGHLDFIRFAHAEKVSLVPTCHLRFVNGDDLFGSISNLEGGQFSFRTWFGGTMTIPREAVRNITFLSRGYRTTYEGPYDAGGWVIGNNNAPQCWVYRDGAFIGSGSGTLARDMALTNSSTIDFDLAWSGPYALLVHLYSESLDHLDYNNGSCLVEFSQSQVTFHHTPALAPLHSFVGGAPLPGGTDQRNLHVTIQCNKEEGTIAVFVNNSLVKNWNAEGGLKGRGRGLLFQGVVLSGVTIRLSNIKISEWQGRYEPDPSLTTTNDDTVHFVNHDETTAKVIGIGNGKVSLALGATALEVPLERVTQINLPGPGAAPEPATPWQVRAHFPGGGSLSFQLEKWDKQGIYGKSAIFGPVNFQPGSIRQLEFNLNRPKEDYAFAADKQFEDLDE
ncbi:MAG: hypothetical protein ACLQVY_17055 [Limisphaerales bacterium]